MMILFPIVLLFVAGYVIGDPSSCGSLLPTNEMNALSEQGSLFPNSEQLDNICPGFLSFSRCFQRAMEDTPEDFNEENIGVYRSLDDSFGELCSEGSEMKDNYLANVDCLKQVESQWPTCLNSSASIYKNYKENEGQNETFPGEENCFRRGYAVGCMSEKIFDSCGQDAVDVYQLFMRKYRYVSSECETETAEALKTKYLDYLNFGEGPKEIIYETAFKLAL